MLTLSNNNMDINELNAINRVISDNIAAHNIMPVEIYVKFAYQTITGNYSVPITISTTEMVRILRENILRDFQVPENHYELVEAGQSTPYNVPAEEGQPFIINQPQSIFHRFRGNKCISFYIRMFSNIQTISNINIEENVLQVAIAAQEEPQCMVCQEENIRLTTYFGCSHNICDACCAGCIQSGINRCAICRHRR
jgi:hypothetical protein